MIQLVIHSVFQTTTSPLISPYRLKAFFTSSSSMYDRRPIMLTLTDWPWGGWQMTCESPRSNLSSIRLGITYSIHLIKMFAWSQILEHYNFRFNFSFYRSTHISQIDDGIPFIWHVKGDTSTLPVRHIGFPESICLTRTAAKGIGITLPVSQFR